MIDIFNKKFIFLYQMGKVASTSIANSLNKNNYNVWSTHSLSSSDITRLTFNYDDSVYCNLYEKKKQYYYKNIRNYIYYKQLKKKKKLKIITLVRDPIIRNESFFFQDLNLPINQIINQNDNRNNQYMSFENLINEYHNNFNHFHGINWFDNEIKKYFNIDVYKYEFDKEKGYQIIESNQISLLILKFEKLSKIFSPALQEFISEDINLESKNKSNQKWYYPIYKEFKKKTIYNQKFISEIYTSKFTRHFYTNKEINQRINEISTT